MALVKFVHLLAVLSFAIFQVSFVPLPANALAVERGHVGRDHVHAGIIKRQSGSSKRCKPRKGNDKPPTYPNNNSTTHDNTSHTTTTSTTTTSPHQTPTSTPSRGSKRILAWSNSVESSLKNFIGPNSDILITRWALEPYSSDALGVSYDLFQKSKYLPQLWGHPADLEYSKTLRTGEIVYPVIATFNEPNQLGQSNLSPQAAVKMWLDYVEPLAKYSTKLNSPAVTGDALEWMIQFMNICAGRCTVNAMDIHIYEISSHQAIKYANQFHDQFKMDVWVGEIACHSYSGGGTCDAFEAFYEGVVEFFENTSWIARFGWFGFFPGETLPNGVDAANKMMQCDDPKHPNPTTCYPNALGKRYLAGN